MTATQGTPLSSQALVAGGGVRFWFHKTTHICILQKMLPKGLPYKQPESTANRDSPLWKINWSWHTLNYWGLLKIGCLDNKKKVLETKKS